MRASLRIVAALMLTMTFVSAYCAGQEAAAAPAADPAPAPVSPAPAPGAVSPVIAAPAAPAAPVASVAPASNQQPQQFEYPATVESMMKLWGQLYEVCNKAGIQPWDVHIQQVADDGVVLKVLDKYFAPFVREATKAIGQPLVRLNKLSDQVNANASFDYELAWASDKSTVLDDQLKALGQNGIQVQKKHIQVIVVCVGKPIMQDMFGLFAPPAAPVAATEPTIPLAPAGTAPTGGAVKP